MNSLQNKMGLQLSVCFMCWLSWIDAFEKDSKYLSGIIIKFFSAIQKIFEIDLKLSLTKKKKEKKVIILKFYFMRDKDEFDTKKFNWNVQNK